MEVPVDGEFLDSRESMPRVVARLAIKFNVQSNRSVVILARGRARLSRRIWFCQVLSVVCIVVWYVDEWISNEF